MYLIKKRDGCMERGMEPLEDTDESEEDSPTMSKQRPSVQTLSSPVPVPMAAPAASRSSSRASAGSTGLDFRSGGSCPTCRGTGRIPRGQDSELVALIPYTDKRLKPRRRYCVYMSIVLVAVLVCGGVLLAFMFPRSASLSLIAMHSSNTSVSYNLNSSITILIQTEVRIQNRNFFPLEVKGLTIYLYNIKTQVSDFTHDAFSVGARKSITAEVSQNATFSDSLADRVRLVCTGKGWKRCLSMQAEVEMQYTVLSHTAEAVTSKYFFVSCDFIEESVWTDTDSCT